MRGFENRTSVREIWNWLNQTISTLPTESIPLVDAYRRIVAQPILSQIAIPSFRRSMMDGYAVQAVDIENATRTTPANLRIIDESLPARPASATVSLGTAIRIMTGAPLPHGADTVVPVETTELKGTNVDVLNAIPVGKNVAEVGDDIQLNDAVVQAGRRLRPQDLGILSSVGVSTVSVVRRPRVAILITGNELLPASSVPSGYQVVDANGPILASLVKRDGGEIVFQKIISDNRDSLRAALDQDADLFLISGGSSVGQEDFAASVLSEIGEMKFHGVAMRPSAPSGIATIGEKFAFLIPGNPVSCLCSYDFFAGRAVRKMGGMAIDWPYRTERLPLATSITSAKGRTDYARVVVRNGKVEQIAISGASILSSTTKADGFIIIEESTESLEKGAEVDLFWYDS